MVYEKLNPREHYSYPLRIVKTVLRKGRQHTDILSCGHTVGWRGSSAWKEGENMVTGAISKRRCQDCFVAEAKKVEDAINDVRTRRNGPDSED